MANKALRFFDRNVVAATAVAVVGVLVASGALCSAIMGWV